MKNRIYIVVSALLLSCFSLTAHAAKSDADTNGRVFYRYINEQGNKVIAQTISPKYVRAGYEVVNLRGEVIKVVAASPSEAEAERVNNEKAKARLQAENDLLLHRSYSNVSDIDAAKARNLLELNNNINILQANLTSVKSQLQVQEQHAAATERSGRKASDEVLNNIKTLRSEEKEVNSQIKQRQQELETVANKYDADKKRFIQISSSSAQGSL